ncbi:MAG: head-tail joining protein [Hoeflea sp.]|uniref:head-tail joining protein n=1 Tax=Hoeflea sp. TaxID=1940281 RepID=UPI003EF86AA1
MTSIIDRPGLFAAMGTAFTSAFGNVDVTLTIDGVVQEAAVRGILRQVREIDLMPEGGATIEGVTHSLALDAVASAGLRSDRDRVTIGAITYAVRALADDGRAMATLLLTGDI